MRVYSADTEANGCTLSLAFQPCCVPTAANRWLDPEIEYFAQPAILRKKFGRQHSKYAPLRLRIGDVDEPAKDRAQRQLARFVAQNEGELVVVHEKAEHFPASLVPLALCPTVCIRGPGAFSYSVDSGDKVNVARNPAPQYEIVDLIDCSRTVQAYLVPTGQSRLSDRVVENPVSNICTK